MKSSILIFAVISALILISCNNVPDTEAPDKDTLDVEAPEPSSYAGVLTVKLEIHDSSLKSLVIQNDGTVTFTEYDKTSQDKISSEEMESLERFILENDFFSLNETCGDEWSCNDCIAHTITVTIGDKTHSVYCYDACPEQFDKIVDKIKSLWPYEIEYGGFA